MVDRIVVCIGSFGRLRAGGFQHANAPPQTNGHGHGEAGHGHGHGEAHGQTLANAGRAPLADPNRAASIAHGAGNPAGPGWHGGEAVKRRGGRVWRWAARRIPWLWIWEGR